MRIPGFRLEDVGRGVEMLALCKNKYEIMGQKPAGLWTTIILTLQ